MVLLDLELVVYQLDPVPKWAVQGVLFDPVREHSVRLGAGGACSDAVGPWVVSGSATKLRAASV